ncbi:uncharacterized protein LOC118751295 [Rhagoletis pomonella]|uniref:uncharacterized protein LOC118751295 n=1 Tax=Rhagoletis pomonella TaxID=28610 RepID=UPI0017827CB9|nr:uncharacterized protein LOC118751295 [Rhagoletis pomonella]
MPPVRKYRVRDCSSSNAQTRMFAFPQDPHLAKKWKDNIGVTPADGHFAFTNAFICEHHFEEEAVGPKLLKRNAVPTLHLGADARGCPFCNLPLSVNHLLSSCSTLQSQRHHYFKNADPIQLLKDPTDDNITRIYKYLKDSDLLRRI